MLESFAYLQPMYGIILERDKGVGYYYRKLDGMFKQEPKMSFEAACEQTNPSESKGERQVQLTQTFIEGSSALEQHKFWEEFEKLSEGERKLAEYQANRMIKQTADRVKHKYKNFGNLPAGLVAMLEGILASMKPNFNWRRLLRLFAASSNLSLIHI